MDLILSKKLPYFSEYIKHELESSKRKRRTVWTWPILIPTAFASVLGITLLQRLMGAPLSVLLVLGCAGVALALTDQSLRRPRNSEERFQAEFDAVIHRYVQSMNVRRLHRDLDMTAGQLLEASAYYWGKIRLQLESPTWSGDQTPLHLMTVRQQTLAAINEAMREQAMLCVRCLALPGQKKTDLRDMIEDAIGIDVDKVLDGFKGVSSIKGKFQSEHLPAIFDTSRQLAEKLRDLSEEIDKMTFENMQRLQSGVSSGASSSLDSALRGLQDIRIATDELDAEIKTQQQQL